MKNIPLVWYLSATLFVGFQPFSNAFSREEVQMLDQTPNATLQINWQNYGQLPAAQAHQHSLGLSAAFTGTIGNYLIVAGGSNFPNGHPFFDQGKKAFYSDIFVFDTAAAQLQLVGHAQLPYPVANGSVVELGNALLFVGGQNNEGGVSTVLKMQLEGSTPVVSEWGKLPFEWQSGAAAWHHGALYLFGGERNGKATSASCKYEPSLQKCIELLPIPGPDRVQFPAIQHDDKFYLFGGIDNDNKRHSFVRTDAYVYDFYKETWTELSEVRHNKKPFSVAGGAAIVLSDTELLVLGGVNLQLFNDALYQLQQLKGDELTAFKQAYFSKTPEEINFSRQQLVFNLTTGKWRTLADKVPFLGGAGPLTLARTRDHIYWIGGEIRPVTRSAEVYRGEISSLNQ